MGWLFLFVLHWSHGWIRLLPLDLGLNSIIFRLKSLYLIHYSSFCPFLTTKISFICQHRKYLLMINKCFKYDCIARVKTI
jgi:hypothetical protein